MLVELGRAEEAADIPRPRLVEAEAEPRAEELVAFVLPEPLGLVEQRAAFDGELVEPEAEPLVELVVVRRVELADGVAVDAVCVEIERIQVLVEQPEPFLVERAAACRGRARWT